MPKQPYDLQRKNEHIFLSEKFYQSANADFQQFRVVAPIIPDITSQQIDSTFTWPSTKKVTAAPLYINAMTGGAPQVTQLNRQLAQVANQLNLAMAVGSMSNYLRYPDNAAVRQSYQIVRQTNPEGVILANVSAATTCQDAQKCIDLIQADYLQVHVNAAQEVVMPEGQTNFCWSQNLKDLITQVSVPVIIKEVGCGMSVSGIQQLQQLGVQNIDIGGRGGTNFVQIENERNHQTDYQFLQNWGLTTLESLLAINQAKLTDLNFWASGGVRNPLDAVKCLILGAKAVGIAAPVLHSLKHSGLEQTIHAGQEFIQQLQQIMLLLGCQNITELTQVHYVLSSELVNFLQQI